MIWTNERTESIRFELSWLDLLGRFELAATTNWNETRWNESNRSDSTCQSSFSCNNSTGTVLAFSWSNYCVECNTFARALSGFWRLAAWKFDAVAEVDFPAAYYWILLIDLSKVFSWFLYENKRWALVLHSLFYGLSVPNNDTNHHQKSFKFMHRSQQL